MPGLQQSVAQAMGTGGPPAPGQPNIDQSVLANMPAASDDDERYVEEIMAVVGKKLYEKGMTEKARDILQRKPDAKGVTMVSVGLMEAALQATLRNPTPQPEDAGNEIVTEIVDEVLQLGEDIGAFQVTEELASQALIQTRRQFMQMHPEIYGSDRQGGPNGAGLPGGGQGLIRRGG